MRTRLRQIANTLFTLAALASVVLVVAALVGILLPMIWRGSGAVAFQGTVEFRRMQIEQLGRGDRKALQEEMEQANRLRDQAWGMLDRFAAAMDPSDLVTRVRQLHREFSTQIDNRDLRRDQTTQLKSLSRSLRDKLLAAMDTQDTSAATANLDEVLSHAEDGPLRGTVAAGYFDAARHYRDAISGVDLARRDQYVEPYRQVRSAVEALLGPRPGKPLPALVMQRYGATRWDQAREHLANVLWAREWVADGPGRPLRQVAVPREQQFAGTELAGLFPLMRDNAAGMLLPRWTFYWQYFIDDSLSGHYFGGVGPEVIGTLLITVLAILFAMPIGVITAGYLIECAGDGPLTRLLRMCINTLAGVPSIVFGLFGLAFFVIYLLPKLGAPQGSSIVSGAMTLALLVLPVVIRASEEAIRSVPSSYREASLALGASRLHCFVTVTLPAAMPGILTGLILSMSRAAGETAPILFTAAVAMGPVPSSLLEPTRTLSYSSYDMAVGDRMAAMAPHNQYGMVMTLVGIVLLLNIVAIVLRGRMARKLRGQ